MLASLLIKLQGLRSATSLKYTLAKVFSCEYSGIFKNTFFTEQLRETTFENILV